jgi:hypothetical protein
MTQDEFAALIRRAEGSRVGRILRSRMVVHSTYSNSSFKTYYARDLWIAETWDPIAFLFPLQDSNVVPVVSGLLSVPLHSQYDYVQEHFPSAIRLASCSVLDVDAGVGEAEIATRIQNAVKLESTISLHEFSDGFRIHAGGALIVLLYIGIASSPVKADEILVYCSEGALQYSSIQNVLMNAKLNVAIDDDCS